MTTPLDSLASAAAPHYRESYIPTAQTVCEVRPDGVLLLSSQRQPLKISETCFGDFARRWAVERPEQWAIQARAGNDGGWRGLRWSELWLQVQSVSCALLGLGLGPEHPLMILSDNSVEQAVLTVAAEYVGIPVAAVSPAYALQAGGWGRLKALYDLLTPSLVFVQDMESYRGALTALCLTASHEVLAVHGSGDDHLAWQSMVGVSLLPHQLQRVAEAHATLDLQQVARIFFTSGSTGNPKGVPLSYANLHTFFAQVIHQAGPGPSPILLDWLPWNHAYGGLGTMGRIFAQGGSLYIDDGRPTPQLFSRTLRNLREVSPSVFATVPATWVMLLAELERDSDLARRFFQNLQYMSFGSASLPQPLWARIQRLAEETTGERIVFVSGFGSTETGAMGSNYSEAGDDSTNIGVPQPGVELKLLPLEGGDGRYELRMRGGSLFSGYYKRPDLTAQAFDNEGFYCLGDAVRLVDPQDARRGMRYAGRIVEDFKLISGTWVRTGAVRVGLIGQCAPLLQDAVICGHDKADVTALAWLNLEACRTLAPELQDLDAQALITHALVRQAVQMRLFQSDSTSSASTQVRRLLLMAEPASIAAGEIGDKGYVNQAAVRQRRAALVDLLYQQPVPAQVFCRT